jgi:hypothetical protein
VRKLTAKRKGLVMDGQAKSCLGIFVLKNCRSTWRSNPVCRHKVPAMVAKIVRKCPQLRTEISCVCKSVGSAECWHTSEADSKSTRKMGLSQGIDSLWKSLVKPRTALGPAVSSQQRRKVHRHFIIVVSEASPSGSANFIFTDLDNRKQ